MNRARRRQTGDTHEWVSFEDRQRNRSYAFDVTFLLSPWTCLYGFGCIGVLSDDATALEQGCCSYGAYLSDRAEARRVESAARSLTAEQWQFRTRGRRTGVVKQSPSGDHQTRLADGACIFLNRPGFPGGAGCALHRAALERGERPMDTKPDVCWQLPLHREEEEFDDGHVRVTVQQWRRRHWGGGGADFHWWCTESDDAFVAHEPVYVTMKDELVGMVGPSIYRRLAEYLDERSVTATALPHPAVRRARP